VHFNATLSYNFRKPLWIGVNAYYLDQITDGKVNGVAVSRSPEQVGALGPGILWNQNAHWHWYADAYQEFGAKNLLKATNSFYALSGPSRNLFVFQRCVVCPRRQPSGISAAGKATVLR
jgi:Putative MetA-pathway of phenol degradation